MADEIAGEAPGGFKFKAVGQNVIPLLTLLAVVVMLVGGYFHDAHAAERNTNLVSVIKESNQIQREMLSAQRESNCLARLTPEQKNQSQWIEYCRLQGRGG